jgi:hypothetical protein
LFSFSPEHLADWPIVGSVQFPRRGPQNPIERAVPRIGPTVDFPAPMKPTRKSRPLGLSSKVAGGKLAGLSTFTLFRASASRR